MEVKVKSTWHGKVGINANYLFNAKKKRENIVLVHGDGKMVIPFDRCYELSCARSEGTFKDKYGRNPYYLYYYNWKPEIEQAKLLG